MLLLLIACALEPVCTLWFSDLDGDGFGSGDGVRSCVPLDGRTEQPGDCDDRDALWHPDAVDPPNDGLDQDCSGDEVCDKARLVTVSHWDCQDGPVKLEGLTADPSSDASCVCAIDGDLRLSGAAEASAFTALQSVSGTLWIGSNGETSAAPADLIMPSLTGVGKLRIDGNAGVVDLPALEQATSVQINDAEALLWPKLHTVEVLSVSLRGAELYLPALESAWELQVYSREETLRRVLFPSLISAEYLRIQAAEHLQLQGPGEAIESLEVWSASTASLQLPEALSELSLAGGEHRLGGTRQIQLLVLDERTRVYATDLERIGQLALPNDATLEAPALTEVDQVVLTRGTLIALQLTQLDSLHASQSQVSLPRLHKVGSLTGKETALPELEHAEKVDFVGELSALTQVDEALLGAPILPAMEYLYCDHVRITTGESSLPSLRHSASELRIEGPVWLPSLRRVDGPLVLIDSKTFYAPELQTVDWLTLRGESTAALPDPLPWGLRLEDWSPESAQDFGVLERGLTVSDGAIRPPTFSVHSVQGNVVLDAPNWVTLPLTLGPISGDLSYCLASVAEADLQAWLAERVVDGDVLEVCE